MWVALGAGAGKLSFNTLYLLSPLQFRSQHADRAKIIIVKKEYIKSGLCSDITFTIYPICYLQIRTDTNAEQNQLYVVYTYSVAELQLNIM